MREFAALLRSQGDPADRVAFLRQHRDRLQQRAASIAAAVAVLTGKIDHYAATEDARSTTGQVDVPGSQPVDDPAAATGHTASLIDTGTVAVSYTRSHEGRTTTTGKSGSRAREPGN